MEVASLLIVTQPEAITKALTGDGADGALVVDGEALSRMECADTAADLLCISVAFSKLLCCTR